MRTAGNMPLMPVKTTAIITAAATMIFLGGALHTMVLIPRNETAIGEAETCRHGSYQLADELRQSSDDLTRMARTYAVTGDPRDEECFLRILSIRDGAAHGPLDYGDIYWDFVAATGMSPRADGVPIALETLVRQVTFTKDEISLLRTAQARSDALAALEERAMKAMKSLFPDESGAFTVAGCAGTRYRPSAGASHWW